MRYSRNGLKDLLSVAKEAALRAGNALNREGDRGRVTEAESARDIKIAADRRAEDIIVSFLRRRSPFGIITEESGLIEGNGGEKKFKWVVDPLDGSFNFSRKVPISCVSVGLWNADEPVLGAIYDFNRPDLFLGIAGMASWLNGRKIGVSSVKRKDKAVLLTGLPSRTDFSKKAIASFVNSLRSYKKVRFLGSAALSLAYVARGAADVYCENNIMIWDVAAGIPIVLGAGGRCRVKRSPKEDVFAVYASNEELFEGK